MKQCIIFARVSTEGQSIEEQMCALQETAINDGYAINPDYIINIKESAIKLDEEHRDGINKMKQLIENDDTIDCVYIWEVSRMARWKHILFNLEHFLVERKIQLIVLSPQKIVLLDENRELNQNADWVFLILAKNAETEMMLKMERFKRARREHAKQGKAIHHVPFGYAKDKNMFAVVDKEKAVIVKTIFKLALTCGNSQIVSYLSERGIYLSLQNINNILQCRAYINDYHDAEGNKITFPRLMSDEQFNKVQLCRQSRNVGKKERTWHLCAKLIKCPMCGSTLVRRGVNYMCYRNVKAIQYYDKANYCNNGRSCSCSMVDQIALKIATNCLFIDSQKSQKQKKRELQKELSEIKNKRINTIQSKLTQIQIRIDRINDMYEMNTLSKDKYIEKINVIRNDERTFNETLSYLQNRVSQIEQDISSIEFDKRSIREEMVLLQNLQQRIYSPIDAYEITHRYIKQINVKYVGKQRTIYRFETTNNGIELVYVKGSGRTQTIWTTSELETLCKPLADVSETELCEVFK